MTRVNIGAVTPNQMTRMFRHARQNIKVDIKRALMPEAMKTRNQIVEYTPVDTGLLRASNRVELKDEGSIIRLTHLNNQVYAAVQHEEMWFRHKVGMAKYVEIPFLLAIDRYTKAILTATLRNMAGGQ